MLSPQFEIFVVIDHENRRPHFTPSFLGRNDTLDANLRYDWLRIVFDHKLWNGNFDRGTSVMQSWCLRWCISLPFHRSLAGEATSRVFEAMLTMS